MHDKYLLPIAATRCARAPSPAHSPIDDSESRTANPKIPIPVHPRPNTPRSRQKSIQSAETPSAAATPRASHPHPQQPSYTSPTPNDTNQIECRPRGSKPPSRVSQFSSPAQPLPPQNPETTSAQTLRPAASHEPSHPLSSRQPPRQSHPARPADSAWAPTPPSSRRDKLPTP